MPEDANAAENRDGSPGAVGEEPPQATSASVFGWTDKHRAPAASGEQGPEEQVVVAAVDVSPAAGAADPSDAEPAEPAAEAAEAGEESKGDSRAAPPPLPTIQEVELPAAPEEFALLAEKLVRELDDSCEPLLYYVSDVDDRASLPLQA